MSDKIFAVKVPKHSLLYNWFVYFDVVCADEELLSQKIFSQFNFTQYKISHYMKSKQTKYVVTFCKIRKGYEDDFSNCLEYFPTAMALRGFLDYETFVSDSIAKLISSQNIKNNTNK